MNTISKIFMAFAAGSETKNTVFQKYIGVGSVTLVAVNPTKEEFNTLFGSQIQEDKAYVGDVAVTSATGEEKVVPYVKIEFIASYKMSTISGELENVLFRIPFYLRGAYRYTKDASKVQVINKYGELTWLTVEDAKNKVVPSSLSWFESGDFRPALIGEEELTSFIKTYLAIPNKSYRKESGEVIEIANKEDAEARLDKITEYFKGNFTELKNILELQPNNTVTAAFGVKTTSDNRQYQDVFTGKFLRGNSKDYTRLETVLKEKKAAGMYPNTEFDMCPIHVYEVEPTKFNPIDNTDLPANNKVNDLPW